MVKKLIRKYNFDKKDLNFFDYFIYYHDLQTDIIKELRKKLEKNNINKIVKIGLPRLFPVNKPLNFSIFPYYLFLCSTYCLFTF